MLTWLKKENILPGREISIISEDKFGDCVLVTLNKSEKRVSLSVASQILFQWRKEIE